jgi:hypothetical protein
MLLLESVQFERSLQMAPRVGVRDDVAAEGAEAEHSDQTVAK